MRIFQTLIDESINILPSLCFEIEKNLFWVIFESVQKL